MKFVQRLLLALAAKIAAHYGLTLVRATPHALLPSRVQRIEDVLRKSGHLARVYNVRTVLERAVADVRDLLEWSGSASQQERSST